MHHLNLIVRLAVYYMVATLALLLSSGCAHAGPEKIDDYHWSGIERVVAVGDLHGDYEQYIKVLRSAELVNARGKWTGGNTHLVQTGDVPDRGADTRKIIDHLADLKKSAIKKGGYVHTLIGNHEAMNSYGDLRYTHPGEYAAFTTRNSSAIREKQWEFQLQRIKKLKPEEFLVMNLDEYRVEWEEQIPLGWVEHRMAWQPGGEYGQKVASNPVAVMINDTIYLHGGISPTYCHMSLQELTEKAWAELKNYDRETEGVIDSSDGPLWYRGLANEDEEYFSPAVDQILARYGASRVVVGHTPTGGVIWPRFNARVVVNDTGIAAHYGSNDAYLELSGGSARAGYGGHKFGLPANAEGRTAYLEQLIELRPGNEALQKRLSDILTPPAPATEPAPATDIADGEAVEGTEVPAEPPREPISPGICQ